MTPLWAWELVNPLPFTIRGAMQVTLADGCGGSMTWINGALVEERYEWDGARYLPRRRLRASR